MTHPYMSTMKHFRYSEPAIVFVGSGRLRRGHPTAYRRFPTGAEAVRLAIEMQRTEKLAGTVMKLDDVRFGAAEVRDLHDRDEYPLPRQRVI